MVGRLTGRLRGVDRAAPAAVMRGCKRAGGCYTPTFPRRGADSASWLKGDPGGEHVQSMGQARCRRSSEDERSLVTRPKDLPSAS
eukprot:3637102-Prymnesium_polylepis.1